MKITKRQIKRIIKEEKAKIINEGAPYPDAALEFEETMNEIAELLEQAFEIAGRPEAARAYWYNGILSQIDPEKYGMMNRSLSMADTLAGLSEGDDDDMMEMGYEDGLAGKQSAYPDNELYMNNYEDGRKVGQQGASSIPDE